MTKMKSICCREVIIASFSLLLCVQAATAQSTPATSKKFTSKVSVAVKDESLRDFLKKLADEHQLSIEIDDEALEEEGISADEKLSLELDDVQLQTVLELAAQSFDLVCVIEGANARVTTIFAVHDKLFTRTHSIPWIRQLNSDSTAVVNLLEQTVGGPWMSLDGEGGEFARIGPDSLTISQHWFAHQEISQVLTQIESIIARRGPVPQDPLAALTVRKLNKRVELEASGGGLRQGLELLLKANGINFWIDRQELKSEGLTTNMRLNYPNGKRSISEHLSDLLEPQRLTAVLHRDMIIVTTIVATEDDHIVRVYDVRKQVRQLGSTDAVIDALIGLAGTGPWMEVDGTGGSAAAVGPLLTVRQNRASHKKIANVLK